MFVIDRLSIPVDPSDLQQLADLLVDAVASGAAVTFLPPLSSEQSLAWWQGTIERSAARAIYLVARDGALIVGTVQLQPASAPNQPHRAEIAKLIVHREFQRQGIGRQLMEAIELEAALHGFLLLTLDTKHGDPAERLYKSLG